MTVSRDNVYKLTKMEKTNYATAMEHDVIEPLNV